MTRTLKQTQVVNTEILGSFYATSKDGMDFMKLQNTVDENRGMIMTINNSNRRVRVHWWCKRTARQAYMLCLTRVLRH